MLPAQPVFDEITKWLQLESECLQLHWHVLQDLRPESVAYGVVGSRISCLLTDVVSGQCCGCLAGRYTEAHLLLNVQLF